MRSGWDSRFDLLDIIGLCQLWKGIIGFVSSGHLVLRWDPVIDSVYRVALNGWYLVNSETSCYLEVNLGIRLERVWMQMGIRLHSIYWLRFGNTDLRSIFGVRRIPFTGCDFVSDIFGKGLDLLGDIEKDLGWISLSGLGMLAWNLDSIEIRSSLIDLCFLFWLLLCCRLDYKSGLMGKGLAGLSEDASRSRRKIKISFFDNSALIAGYSKTVIGRCFNPQVQDMKSLLIMMPQIWQVEGRVAGAELGSGKFQFDFDEEADIVEVMKKEPFHFDSWMVSLVRWTPVVDPAYPSSLKFWIRVSDVPIQFWAEPTFRDIGSALGLVEDVDIDRGRVQVTIDGLKPLCFETDIEFYNGEVTIVKLHYERLYGWCNTPNSDYGWTCMLGQVPTRHTTRATTRPSAV
ncbi:PREDICTED: uncharacterized protein LOC104766931 isoform X2 [Camelina sativa]|uniref:Uncharacterized protein LOC104766931 isoform X2 n=1 Tax=Camelina sativa TaxID=90675 RepID=A0ABM0XQ25_CAMSA|nr:PREDICTED: uncharacterized protein LOC104766931 isoform X2 [Camelina sativa]